MKRDVFQNEERVSRTRGHNLALVKRHSRLDVRKDTFSKRVTKYIGIYYYQETALLPPASTDPYLLKARRHRAVVNEQGKCWYTVYTRALDKPWSRCHLWPLAREVDGDPVKSRTPSVIAQVSGRTNGVPTSRSFDWQLNPAAPYSAHVRLGKSATDSSSDRSRRLQTPFRRGLPKLLPLPSPAPPTHRRRRRLEADDRRLWLTGCRESLWDRRRLACVSRDRPTVTHHRVLPPDRRRHRRRSDGWQYGWQVWRHSSDGRCHQRRYNCNRTPRLRNINSTPTCVHVHLLNWCPSIVLHRCYCQCVENRSTIVAHVRRLCTKNHK